MMPTAPVPPSSLPPSSALIPPPQITGSPILSSALTSPNKLLSTRPNFLPQLPTQPLATAAPRTPTTGGPILASMLQRPGAPSPQQLQSPGAVNQQLQRPLTPQLTPRMP